MRLYCLFSMGIVFMSHVLIAQDSTFKKPKYLQLAETIDHDKTKKRIHLQNKDFLAHPVEETGTLDGYFSKGKLRKIHCFITYEFGTDVKDFYFSEGKLVYVRHTRRRFVYDDKNNSYRHDSLESPYNGRYFFRDGLLLHYDITETGHHFESEKEDIESSVMEEAEEWVRILKREQVRRE